MNENEPCHYWITDDPHHKPWPKGHLCNQPATEYLRVGEVVEHVCAGCYQHDIANGAHPSNETEYKDWLESA